MEQPELHRIKAFLYDNPLTEDPNDLVARVSGEHSLDVEKICVAAVVRGGADISAESMKHAAELFLREMSYQLCDGFGINTGYFTAGVHIKGVFTEADRRLDPERHSILFEFHQGALLREELSRVHVDILGLAEPSAKIAQVIDVKTGSVNDVITRGRNIKIIGHRIKVAGENPPNNIHFINSNGSTTYVPETDIVVNNPSEIIIVVPGDLPTSGTCQLEITTRYSGSTLLKVPHSLLFDKPLTAK